MMLIFANPEVIKELLSTESITMIGLLLGVIAILIYHIRELNKIHEKEKIELKQDIKEARSKLDIEYDNSNTEIKSIIEKYYTLATKVLEKLNTVI